MSKVEIELSEIILLLIEKKSINLLTEEIQDKP